MPTMLYGSGFCRIGCSPVTLVANGLIVATDVQVATDGTFTATIHIASGPGQYLIAATQTDTGKHQRKAITGLIVVPSDTNNNPTTPPATTPHTSVPGQRSNPPGSAPRTSTSRTSADRPPELSTTTTTAAPEGSAASASSHGSSGTSATPWIVFALGAIVVASGAGLLLWRRRGAHTK
jgi:hypothetical protein